MSDAIESPNTAEMVRLHLVPVQPVAVVDDATVAPDEADSDRASFAMLALRVRSAQAEAEAAERAVAVAGESACAVLRQRLDLLREQRRAVLDAEVVRAEEAAAVEIAAATQHARGFAAEADEPSIAPDVVGLPSAAVLQRSADARTTLQTPPVVIDVDTLARVCAMVVTEVLEQRYGRGAAFPAHPMALPAGYVAMPAAAAQQQQERRFWRTLMSGDVLLIGLAAVIVAVVILAWLA
jgi:hypothetical protein